MQSNSSNKYDLAKQSHFCMSNIKKDISNTRSLQGKTTQKSHMDFCVYFYKQTIFLNESAVNVEVLHSSPEL